MRVVIGIDLGSTTCKAVVLNEKKEIIGRGITNTRSNYKMATEIATREALVNARLEILRQNLSLDEATLNQLEESYYLKDYRHKHQILVEKMRGFLDQQGKKKGMEVLKEMAKKVEEHLQKPETLQAIRDRSRFFKDFMYAFYMDEAEKLLPVEDLNYEGFLGILDKGIVQVENEVMPMDPGAFLKESLSHLSDKAPTEETNLEVISQVGTGYGRQLLPFPEEQIRSEILCHGRGAYYFFPETRTVLDIGGQDTKAIQLDEKGIVRSFFMNDRCAAGCGRYLGYVAEEMGMSIKDLGPTACSACRYIPISSTCTVFAGAELRDLLYAGEAKEEILLGLHRAIVLRALSLLARSGGIFNEFTFTGGVAKNTAVVKILKEMVQKRYQGITINIHPDSIYMGALGAALYAAES